MDKVFDGNNSNSNCNNNKGFVAIKAEYLLPSAPRRNSDAAVDDSNATINAGKKRKADELDTSTAADESKACACNSDGVSNDNTAEVLAAEVAPQAEDSSNVSMIEATTATATTAEEAATTAATATEGVTTATASDAVVSNPEQDQQQQKQQQQQAPKQKVTLKQRHQSTHPTAKEDRICSFVQRGEQCPYSGSCCYSHDVLDFLQRKPADIGSSCYNYTTFGYCSSGVACRFGSEHIDSKTGANLIRSDNNSADDTSNSSGSSNSNSDSSSNSNAVVVARQQQQQMNVLKKEVQVLLRKKRYLQHLREEQAAARKDLTCNSNNNSKNNTDIATTDGTAAAAIDSCINNDTATTATTATTTTTTTTATTATTTDAKPQQEFRCFAYPDRCMRLVDFSNKVYVAPLTTVGNLPFRRILREYGADITCGEMAMAHNLMAGQASEWALLRKHRSEDCFGIQLAGNGAELMANTARLLERETTSHFVDLNCGCPIDVVCGRGSGSSLMTKPNKLCSIVESMAKYLPSRSITVKIRTGWSENDPSTHKLLPLLQDKPYCHRIAALMIHGRSRLQRYQKLADWAYVLRAARSQDPCKRRIPVIGNGDILSFDDWQQRQLMLEENLTLPENRLKLRAELSSSGSGSNMGTTSTSTAATTAAEMGEFVKSSVDLEHADGDVDLLGLCSCAMLGRGALMKPWLPQEIKEQRSIDIPATERLEIIKKFCNYGLEHWGSDNQGVANTRRFLLEWMSFLHRYVPAGITLLPQRMNERPPNYFGRCDLETLLSSAHCSDWIKVSEMFLGPVPKGFAFIPKHKSNSYAAPVADAVAANATATAAAGGGGFSTRGGAVNEWG